MSLPPREPDLRAVYGGDPAPPSLPPAVHPSFGLWQLTGVPPWRLRDAERAARRRGQVVLGDG